jgi:hypothetical protein
VLYIGGERLLAPFEHLEGIALFAVEGGHDDLFVVPLDPLPDF